MPRPDPHPIYSAFLNSDLCTLIPEDREHLRTHRGFPDETIDSGRFKSARPENAQIVEALQTQFGRDELIDAGLLSVREGRVEVNRQLVEPGHILIPYLCDDRTMCYHLRRHKHGFKGVPVNFYCAGAGEELVLAESEFKAVASYCLGYPAVGVPGISSFVREHFDRLIRHINSNNVTRVIVCFDNEIKNDPAFPNFKADPEKRWDTQYYAALMAIRIAENGGTVETAVATLPDAWRVQGKIDIDGALAARHTNEEYAACIDAALRPEDYIDSLPEEAQSIVRRKIRAFCLSLRIRRMATGYEVYEKPEFAEGFWKPISNFTFDIKAKLETANKGIVRLVSMRQGPRESDIFKIEASDMVKTDNFQTAFYRHGTGEAWYKGDKEQLIDIFDLEHNRGPVSVVVEPDHVGKIVGKDMWLFGDTAIIKGNIVHPDANKIFWNGVKGYTVGSVAQEDEEDQNTSKWTSRIPRPDFSAGAKVSLQEVASRLYENFGGADGGHNAVAAFCWGLSCAFSHDFFEEYGCFPILYLRGLKETGKSTLARWILRMFGIMNPGFNTPGGSLPGIQRLMAYYSSLPVFLDECRDDVVSDTKKESFFRSAYDRQPVVKADGPQGLGVAMPPIRSPIMMAGEHSPKDPALMTRCIFAEFSAERRGFGSQFEWLDNQSRKTFPRILSQLLMEGPAVGDLVAQAETFRKLMQNKEVGVDPRAARNFSILLTIYNTLVDPKDSMGIAGSIMSMAKSSHEDQKEDTDIMRFFEDLPLLRDQNQISSRTDYTVDGGVLYMHLRRCWEAWQKRQREIGGKAPSYKTALMQLRQTKYFCHSKDEARSAWHVIKLAGQATRCVGIYLDPSKGCPICLIDFAIPKI